MFHRRNSFYLRPEGPPLISLWDSDYVPLKRFNDQQKSKEVSISDESEYWVAVYGFDPENINSVIDVFRDYGRIINFVEIDDRADNQSSLHICFERKFAAQHALEQDDQIINHCKIGVFGLFSAEDTEKYFIDSLFATGEIRTRTQRRHSVASEYYYLTPDAAESSFFDFLFKWKISISVIPIILFFLVVVIFVLFVLI